MSHPNFDTCPDCFKGRYPEGHASAGEVCQTCGGSSAVPSQPVAASIPKGSAPKTGKGK